MSSPIDESYRLLAARHVRKQLRQLTGQFDGIRKAEDVECVHRARVASRRLRAGLRMFRDCFDRKTAKRWRKEVRRLTDGLGDARDKDVQIEFVCDVLCRLEHRAHCPGIARLLVKLEHQRESLQPRVRKVVDRFESSPVPKEMNSATKRLVSELTGRGVDVKSEFVFRQAERHVHTKLDELRAYQDSLAHPEDQRRHHAMRIAAKRLRYTMEICKPVYDGQLDEFTAAVKQVQMLLGNVHDCDVWIEQLDELLKEERQRIDRCYGHDRPLARLRVGIDYLRQERQEERRQVFRALVEYWQRLTDQGLWDNLAGAIRPPTNPPAAPQSPVNISEGERGRGLAVQRHVPEQNRETRQPKETVQSLCPRPAEPERSLDQAN